jgi:hypothetical protein
MRLGRIAPDTGLERDPPGGGTLERLRRIGIKRAKRAVLGEPAP